jgi:drug/metabolite transporter (DMT)-like permease
MESVFAVVGSVLIIGELLTIQIVLGGLLIILAVLLAEIKPFKKRFIKIT